MPPCLSACTGDCMDLHLGWVLHGLLSVCICLCRLDEIPYLQNARIQTYMHIAQCRYYYYTKTAEGQQYKVGLWGPL